MISPDRGGGAEAGAKHAGGRLFGSIESSEEYVGLLLHAVEATASEVGEDLRGTPGLDRRQREALQLAAYKLEQLRSHLTTSRRRLNDLRNLRLIVHGEGSVDQEQEREEEEQAAA